LEKLNNALRSHVDGNIVWLLTDGIIVPLFKIFLAILASVGVLVDLQACYDKKLTAYHLFQFNYGREGCGDFHCEPWWTLFFNWRMMRKHQECAQDPK
jgi:hypothetical protein